MGSSPTSGSVLTTRSLEPALDSVSPSLPLLSSCLLSGSQKMNENVKIQKRRKEIGERAGFRGSGVSEEPEWGKQHHFRSGWGGEGLVVA